MSKYKLLFYGLIIDAVGILTSSWVLPVIGDFADIIWAPLEEIIPGLDIIPSFTLMWFYTYVISKSKYTKDVEVDNDKVH